MSLLMPTMSIDSVTDIDIKLLRSLNIKSILLDVDNTLASHGSQEPFKGVIEWSYKIREQNIKIIIISNNFKNRVAPFAKKFNLPFVSLALKPSPLGFLRAKKFLHCKPENTVVVGDQVFTDILGANLAHMKSILLTPKSEKETLGIYIRRKLEKGIREKIKCNS